VRANAPGTKSTQPENFRSAQSEQWAAWWTHFARKPG
jgi:hypothetical protein